MYGEIKFDSLIDLKLTQESGQTSQSPWKADSNSFTDMIYLNLNHILNETIDESIDLNNVPVLLNLSQSENDINGFNLMYEFAKKSNFNEILSKAELKSIEKKIICEVSTIYDLDFDLDKFYNYLSEDEKLTDSIEFCKGLRLFIAKDPFECIISSICSANNSIARWTKSIDKIKRTWGEKVEFNSGTFYDFPSPDDFSTFYETPIEEAEADGHTMEMECYTCNLKSCGVGYRAPYMIKAGKLFSNELNFEDISNLPYLDAFNLILKTPGVGPKVADCILLYGFNFKEAFPSDVWIKRIISHFYFDDNDISAKDTREFGINHFGDYAGYSQLYLFHYARKSGLMDKLKK